MLLVAIHCSLMPSSIIYTHQILVFKSPRNLKAIMNEGHLPQCFSLPRGWSSKIKIKTLWACTFGTRRFRIWYTKDCWVLQCKFETYFVLVRPPSDETLPHIDGHGNKDVSKVDPKPMQSTTLLLDHIEPHVWTPPPIVNLYSSNFESQCVTPPTHSKPILP